ncbi:MAG: hypothetical protein M9921_12240 [Fimbriimonadaceae bacterium]|nr:hypothetical protein [Fimbriimonadaceae bacterium]
MRKRSTSATICPRAVSAADRLDSASSARGRRLGFQLRFFQRLTQRRELAQKVLGLGLHLREMRLDLVAVVAAERG